MNGADILVSTLQDGGIDTCFANPGTSEMHFLGALDRAPGMRCILGLFEGVVTGAADGYYRMKDRPAGTLLHLGAGLSYGLPNLHNARRASSGVVNIVGDVATSHLKFNAPLTSDIEGLARPISHWVRRSDSVQSIGPDAAAAVNQARRRPGRIATLILPGDVSWSEAPGVDCHWETSSCVKTPPDRIDHAAKILQSGEPVLMILAGLALRADVLDLAGRIAAKTKCRIASQFFSSRIERGAGRVAVERIPYAVEPALHMLRGFRHIIIVETTEPVAFFSYPDKPSLLKPVDCCVHELVEPGGDSLQTLEQLASALGAAGTPPVRQAKSDPQIPQGALDPQKIAMILAASIPENAILVDESLTTGRETFGLTAGAAPHDALQNMGGSIGFGTPVATGAAIACPDRKVICLVGDGSAMYTVQSLWTHARENLDVTTIVFANRSYQILKAEFGNMGAGNPGPRALSMMELDRPAIDWIAMAKSMGVPAVQVQESQALFKAISNALREPGPSLIEVVL